MLARWTKEWFFNPKNDVLAGMTVAIALIPEAIAFSIIAGVDPMVGLHASFCMAVMIAIVGGRPGMISAATGAMALLMVTLVKDHGIEYMYAVTVLTGLIQLLLGYLKVGRFMTFIPAAVMKGFVNALAILIFLAQLVHFNGQSWGMYAMVAATLVVIYVLPRFTKAVPSAMVAIVIMTAATMLFGWNMNTVGDMGEITAAPPLFHLPVVPLTGETLVILLPYAISLALVGLLESLLTASLLDEMTETKSDKNQEVKGQGIANMVTGLFGGMAGCAMIGQSVINVRSGGRGRLSTLVAGVFLLFLILVLSDVVKQIPMAALVGVMIMVCIGTFDWESLRELNSIPFGDGLVMVVTTVVVVYTHDLSKGVLAGVALSAVMFGWKMARLHVQVDLDAAGTKKRYRMQGLLFFGTTTHFAEAFTYQDDPDEIEIDLHGASIWDHSAVTAIEKVVDKYSELGKRVVVTGLSKEGQRMYTRSRKQNSAYLGQ